MQLEFYKKRCEEMQREHKQALVKMMPGYAQQAEAAAAGDEGEDAALYEAETRCAQVEQKVREEVTEEMEAQMKEMDLVFAIRMENERISVEER